VQHVTHVFLLFLVVDVDAERDSMMMYMYYCEYDNYDMKRMPHKRFHKNQVIF